MAKKLLSLFFILCLLLGLTACHQSSSTDNTANTQASTEGTTFSSTETETQNTSTPVLEEDTESTSIPVTEEETESTTVPATEEETESTTVPVTEEETESTTVPVTEEETESTTVPVPEEETENTTDSIPEEETEPDFDLAEPDPNEIDYFTLWTPLCEEYINLWKYANGTQSICQIPVGAKLTLKEWHGKYALVTYQGKQGYVAANYIQPTDPQYFQKRLKIVSPTNQYTYTQMQSDLKALQAAYPELITLDSIGKSEGGLDIPVMILGNPNATYHVLMQGAMHAREHFTAWLLMAIVDNAISMGHLADETICYYIIPMTNPDGVTISQTQSLNSEQEKIYQKDLAYGYTTEGKAAYAEQWKANGLGIDLNRNFPSGWEVSQEHPEPSSSHYRGESPLCAAESKALADYARSRTFDATLSFHSHGSVLYYRYGNKQVVNRHSYELALAVRDATGYIPTQADGTTGAGFKDWALDELGIPSITVEVGSSQTPLAQPDIYNTFSRFETFLPTMSLWITW